MRYDFIREAMKGMLQKREWKKDSDVFFLFINFIWNLGREKER